MIGGELGACLGQVGHRASVLGKDHPCGRVCFGTAGGHGRACLGQGVDHSKMYELSSLRAEVAGYFLEWLVWLGFDLDIIGFLVLDGRQS